MPGHLPGLDVPNQRKVASMTETQTSADTGQSVNGKAPAPAAALPDDTGEKWLGVLVIAAGVFLLFVGIDRVTGGALSGRLFAEGDPGAG